jgi:hypothetical protein
MSGYTHPPMKPFSVGVWRDRETDEAMRKETEQLRAALDELIACEALQARIKAYNPQHLWNVDQQQVFAEMHDQYARRDPLAWAEARRLTAKP